MDPIIENVTPEELSHRVRKFKAGGTAEVETDNLADLCGGKFYTDNPDHLLGEMTAARNRYGEPINVLVGTIANLAAIDAPDDFMQFIKSENIGVSTQNTPLEYLAAEPAKAEFVESIIKQSAVSIGKKAIARRAKKEQFADETSIDVMQKVQLAPEVYKNLNPAISLEELRVYVWHKNRIGQRLGPQWYELSLWGEDPRSDEDKISQWVKSGLLCYYRGELLPQVLYLSGDMYDKTRQLIQSGDVMGGDTQAIIDNYGQDVLDNQIALLEKRYAEVYSKRLILTGNDDGNSLIIKPISKLAREFQVSSLQDIPVLKWWDKKGHPNFEKTDGSDYQKVIYDKLSLTQAFCLWLVEFRRKIDIRGNVTFYDIIYFYIDGRTKVCPEPLRDTPKEAEWKAGLERTKAKAMTEGNRLFLFFLNEQLELNDRVRLESSWNAAYNNYLAPDFNKIPVAFNVTKAFGPEDPFIIKPEKREAVAFLFNEGSGCLAYDVGVGKTMCLIMAIEQFLVAGYAKRPFIVVPNQTYKQWISEIRGILPHRKINGLFNLGVDFIEETYDEHNQVQMVDEGSITVLTYEGLKQIGFEQETENHIMDELYAILNQGDTEGMMSKKGEKKKEGFRAKLENMVGRGLKGTVVPIEQLGFDMFCLDESHAIKKIFTSVKGEPAKEGEKSRNPYTITSGLPSDTALKAFMLGQYIFKNNDYRNIVLLTATPFTNSPLEVFSMTAMIAYHRLKKYGINNIKDFFDTYIDATTELVINHKLQPQYKQVIKGFNNLPALQRLILRYFNYKDGDDVGVVRPNKIVIPYLKKMVDGVITDLPESEKVTSYIPLNDIQREYMAEVVAYAEGKREIETVSTTASSADDAADGALSDGDAQVVSELALSGDEKSGVRALKAMNYSRNLALSPYLYEYNTLGTPTAKDYIETSPKLQYVIECIRSVKQYHEAHNEPVSGQVIYMDRGVPYFPLIKEYLVKYVGFKEHEVGMITSKGMSVDKKRAVQDQFLGRRYNEKIQDYEKISNSERLKVLIGSSSIKEGMNLQKHSTVLYNCFLDWNPTDMIQLQGRIWRQQNRFLNVRIVNPLMIDSIDIFMFQKLEEKTSRINTIWSNDGRSVLKIEEVNPSEIKYALIKDPKIIAKIEVDEKKVDYEDDIRANESIKSRLREFNNAVWTVTNYRKEVEKMYATYVSDRIAEPTTMIKGITGHLREKVQKDRQGRRMFDSWELSNRKYDLIREHGAENISDIPKLNRPYWFDGFTLAARLIEKERKELLDPRDIDSAHTEAYSDKLDAQNADLKEKIKFLESEDYVQRRVEEIIAFREANHIREKSVMELVEEFKTQNHLLSLLRMEDPLPVKPAKFERLDQNGERKTDPETLATLEQLLERLPQTKTLHTDVNGVYTPERLSIHRAIISERKKDVRCVDRSTAPIAILTGGSPSSGKTTFLKTYAPFLLSEEILKIDADEIRAQLPEYEGWNASVTHLETKDIVNTLLTDREIGMPCPVDVIYDGTMNNSKNYLPLIGMLHSLGYKVFIIYMDNVPYQTVKQRAIARYKKTGRFVPSAVIEDFFGKGKTALYELRDKVDGYMIVDASSKDYKIIERGGNPLPEDRQYSELQRAGEIEVKTINEADEIREAIESLEVLRDISDDASEKAEITEAIESLEVLLLLTDEPVLS